MITFVDAYEKGFEKVEYMLQTLDGFPHITRKSKWLTNQNGHWTGGFWTGLLWLDSIYHDSPEMRQIAEKWALKLNCRLNDCTTHDQGFIFGPSCVFGYRLTEKSCFVPMIHAGGLNMIKQYVPETGLVKAWAEAGYEGISIVDTIMNLPILWVSGELSDDPVRKELCLLVADNIQKYAIRDDYSTYHVIRWDNDYNIYGDTHQGFSSESCWSRGQSWAMYGFANMYRYTGVIKYLDSAMKLADYYWEHLNSNKLPAWDFNFINDESQPIDSSSASIAASGLALLSDLLDQKGEHVKAEIYGKRSDDILQAEIDNCLYETLDKYGIICHGTVDLPRKSGVDESTQYGDYYFMEALYRRLNRNNREALSLLY